ncbi:MAG: ComEA family DNA-binding protein [Limnothrix sp. RL_2_0]|nr:ComEA family DNA-binding protein [Limnothrix sp. RL_2_0]
MNFLQKRKLQQQLRQDPYYRFQSLEEVAIGVTVGISIDVNRATIDDWLRLPGLSIHQARSLVALTEQGVQFLTIEDVAAALGLSAQRLQPLVPILNFSYYTPALTPQPININTATPQALAELAIAPELAQRLIAERQNGIYCDFADLQRRLNLSSTIVMDLLPWLRFS